MKELTIEEMFDAALEMLSLLQKKTNNVWIAHKILNVAREVTSIYFEKEKP